MRHQSVGRKLSRSVSHRRALLRNMTTSLVLAEKCETTLAKAQTLRSVFEKLVTLAKNDTLHNRRQAYSYMTDKKAVYKLFTDVAPRFKKRPGGYTRVVRTGYRKGDAAPMAIIQLVAEEATKSKAKKTKTTKKPKAEKAEAAAE